MKRIVAALFFALLPSAAFGLITGGTGNEPLHDPGWPKGAASIFNHKGRVAFWEGPPFGGGQYHAECRGDAKALSSVLADFAKLDIKSKKVVVHDGIGHSFWLAPNREKDKLDAAKIDWVFMVWVPARWENLRKMPADFNPIEATDTSPPSQIDVYTGNLKWADVAVPPGLEIIDDRLESRGYKLSDSPVIEGKVTDLLTKAPPTATIELERVAPGPKGYLYPFVQETKADAQGSWVIKNTPKDWLRIVVSADGYVPRVAGYFQFDDQPHWQSYATSLTRGGTVAGKVSDEAGKPLADVSVRIDHIAVATGGRYELPDKPKVTTDASGSFVAHGIPVGKANVWIHKPGYVGPGLGLNVTVPVNDVTMKMQAAASVNVTVDFTNKKRPAGYMISIKPEGGEVVGSYGGSASIDATNKFSFKDFPPGRYIITGQPNPGSEKEATEPVTVDLKGGQVENVTLKAK